jgi:hypothetical protein
VAQKTPIERVGALARKAGVLRPRDLTPHAIPRHYPRTAEEQGLIQRTSRGLYLPADAPLTEHYSLAEVAKRVPHGVICLLSALRFHDLGTQTRLTSGSRSATKTGPLSQHPQPFVWFAFPVKLANTARNIMSSGVYQCA